MHHLRFLLSRRRPALIVIPSLLVLLFLQAAVFAQQGTSDETPVPVHAAPALQSQEPEGRLDTVRSQLSTIARSIEERRSQLIVLRQQLAEAQTDSERAELEAEIAEVERLLQASRATFESLATGGVDSSIFREVPEAPLDWQQQLLEVVEPFLDQLRQMTEAPRTIERLNRRLSQDQARLDVVNRALAHIAEVGATVEEEPLLTRLQAVERFWLQRKADLELEINLLEVRLHELQAERLTFWEMLHKGMLSFVQGRGLILIVAIIAPFCVWFLLQALARLTRRRRDPQQEIRRKPYSRLLTFGYQAFCFLASLSALLLVLYVSGDWLLLGLALIILILVVLGSRTYLPRFMAEMRMLLDMGPVREGERLFMNGIPWQVKSLNLYSKLYNPDLQGGVLRVPLGELTDKVSRIYDPDEPWFPTRKDDFVLLSDGTFGQVLLQTPEVVQIKHFGSLRTFSTGSFLDSSPRNLTRSGFGASIIFGIDYRHQSICLDEVPGIFESAVTEALKSSDVGDHLESVLVDFREAGTSSLDYLIYVTMNGDAAGSFWAIGRIMQQACVRVCNERGWVIPFTQLTVHQGDGFEALRTPQS